MRPIKLEMSAFGSYGGLEMVEFSPDMRGLFLITGDTGAGKTTVFDAIMYALYDETSGGRREGVMMRSQYAKEDVPTFVRFTFLYGKKEYTVYRSPEYYRQSKRRYADGSVRMVKESSAVELIFEDGTVFQGKKRETDKKIVEIIGLDAEQFRQVAMIAQGDFLKLLHAESKERRLIFSKIFHTHIYRSLQERLKEKAKRLTGQLQDNTRLCRQELERVVCGEEHPYFERWQQQKASGEFSLDNSIQMLAEISKEDKRQLGQLEQLRKSKQEQIARLEEFLRSQDVVEGCRIRILENEKRVEKLQKLLQELDITLQKEASRKETASIRLAAREKVLSEEIVRLKGSLPLYERLEACFKKRRQSEKSRQQLEKQLTEKEEASEQIQKKLEQLAEKLKESETLPVQMLEVRTQAEQWKQQLSVLEDYQEKLKIFTDCQEEQKRVLEQYQSAQVRARECGRIYEAAYESFFREQAGILAQELKEEEPCPVCGSVLHPKKAVLSAQAATQAQVESAKNNRERAEAIREEFARSYAQTVQKCKGQREQLKELGQRILADAECQNAGFEPDKDGNRKISERQNMLRTAYVRSQEKLKALAQQEIQRENSLHEQQKNQERLSMLRTEQQNLTQRLQEELLLGGKQEHEIQMLQGSLSYENVSIAKSELMNREKELDTLKKAVEKAGKDYEQVSREIQMKSGEKKAGEDMRKPLQSELAQAEKQCERQLRLWKEENFGEEPQEIMNQLLKENKELENRQLHLFHRRQINEDALKNLRRYEKVQRELRSEYLIYDDLSRTANGTLNGNVKIDFETYVQRQYFKQIISAANRRLVRMNNYQFLLQCRDMKNLGTQGQVGLDLDVLHLVNHSVRDIKTLSGGESFMAALAMALGLADIIQNEAGAIHLDTMFVDEGFGSLDDESRTQAIGVLLELAGEHRLIGIISHVNELKEQIDQKLIVTKDTQGSRVCWDKL